MSKWYAVKKGRNPGVYTSWSACQTQTNGFSGSVFKTFTDREEALRFAYGDAIPAYERRAGPPNLNLVSASQRNDQFLLGNVPAGNNNSTPSDEWGTLFSEGIVKDDDGDLPKVMGVELPSIKLSPKIHPLSILRNPRDYTETEPFQYPPVVLPRVDHKRFLEADRRILDTNTNLLIVYIDGSKRPTVNHRGSGAYCRFGGKDYSLSVPFSSEIAMKYQIRDSDIELLSSPTMEYIAFGEVLWRFIQIRLPEVNGVVKMINPRLKLIFVSDYLGVKCFTDGSWTPKEDYIMKIHQFTTTIISFLKERGIDVGVEHIDGHDKVLGNELSDILAKSQVAFDSIQTLVRDLSMSFAGRF